MGNNAPFVIERILNAPVETVWKAITEREEMKQWYFDLAEFKAEPGFEFDFLGGKPGRPYKHLCKVMAAEKNRLLTYRWRYEGYKGNSFVTFELFPEGEKTKLRLTHTHLDSFPPDNPDLAKENFAMGWEQIIGHALPDYLNQKH